MSGDMEPQNNLRGYERTDGYSRRMKRRRSSKAFHESSLASGGGGGEEAPSPKKDYDPLKRTKRPFGGMYRDIKHRYPYYLSDFTDGFSFQVVASVLYIYFASVAGAIAFGGLLGSKTSGSIGMIESVMSTSGGVIIFALFSGQPLITVGPTGPLVLFDASLYTFCLQQDIDYLGFRAWVGVWIGIIAILFVMIEATCLARYFTRFIQEMYSGLISLLFCWDCIEKLIEAYEKHPLQLTYEYSSSHPTINDGPQPNTALVTTALCLGTFLIAYSCRGIRDSDYFTPCLRKFLGNFGVPIAIFVMCTVDFFLSDHVNTAKLKVPPGMSNTKERDSWFINPSDVPIVWAVGAVGPAFLAFILIFMETSICGRLVGKKENKLVKGGGYHLDIFLTGLINTAVGLIGGIWICAATVRSVAHASSLTVYSTNYAPGDKPSILGVKEQRVSNLTIGILIGLSVLLGPILRRIPMAVLFAIFLYVGVSSMRGVQMFDRMILFLKQESKHPQVAYVRRVRTRKMHLFTSIQIACLSVLWAVKCSPAALAVPFVIMFFVPLRLVLIPKIFKPHELAALDADGSEPPAPKKTMETEEATTIIIQDSKKVRGEPPGYGAELRELRTIW